MDVLDFFENMGWGLGIVIVIAIFMVLIIILGTIIPVLLMGLGQLLFFVIIILVVGAVIYFIGKFAKDFLKK
jgi:hypothetical protein